MDRLKKLDQQLKDAQERVRKVGEERAIEIVRQIDHFDRKSETGRGGAAQVAKTLGLKPPTISALMHRGRALIAERASKARRKANAV